MFKIGDNVFTTECEYTQMGSVFYPIQIKITSFFNECEIIGMKQDGTEDIYSINGLCHDLDSAMEKANQEMSEASFYEMECEI